MKLNKFELGGGLLLFLLLIFLFFSLKIPFFEILDFDFSFRNLITDVLLSFFRVLATTLLAMVAGIILGYLFFHFKFLNKLFMPSINFIRHISPFAWLPFAIVWFGLGETPIAFIMFITLFFPSLIAATDIFSNIPREYFDEAEVSGANKFQIFSAIEIPLTIPNFINLFRIIWGLGWSTIIAAEMLGVSSGLGFRLLDFRYLLKYKNMLHYLIIMGTLGIIIDYCLEKLYFLMKGFPGILRKTD